MPSIKDSYYRICISDRRKNETGSEAAVIMHNLIVERRIDHYISDVSTVRSSWNYQKNCPDWYFVNWELAKNECRLAEMSIATASFVIQWLLMETHKSGNII